MLRVLKRLMDNPHGAAVNLALELVVGQLRLDDPQLGLALAQPCRCYPARRIQCKDLLAADGELPLERLLVVAHLVEGPREGVVGADERRIGLLQGADLAPEGRGGGGGGWFDNVAAVATAAAAAAAAFYDPL